MKARRQQQKTRQQAINALLETAEAARMFDDFFSRVRIQAAVADELWPFDAQAARAILRRAWETASAPGAVEEIMRDGEPEATAWEYLTSVRSSLIETAAKHDARLSESLMQEFLRALPDAAPVPAGVPENSPARQSAGWRRLSAGGWQRLLVASSLLRGGESKSAARVAAPLVEEGATRELLGFILELRRSDPHAADALYLRLLERTRADARAGANDVLMLSAPVVSPDLLVFIDHNGALNFSQASYTDNVERRREPEPVPVEVRRAFFDTAAAVLLRAVAPQSGGAQEERRGQTAALYFAIGRLLPFFEREAAQYGPALHARQSALAADIETGHRESLSSGMKMRSFARRNPSDPLSSSSEQLARATDAAERDRLRLEMVMRASRLRLWDRARGGVADIESPEAQRSARFVIALHQVLTVSEGYEGDEPDNYERAASFVRGADVPPEVRAVGFAQAAELAARRGDEKRTGELLDEATSLAAQAPQGTTQRAAAFAALALASARVNGGRAWETFAAFVSASNAATDSQGDALGFEYEIETPKGKDKVFIEPFLLEDVFETMARLDFSRALSEIRALEDEATRAEATIAAARTALNPLKKTARMKDSGGS